MKTVLAALALSIVVSPAAFADAATEAYVEENANEVLRTLNDPSLNSEERTATFNAYMDEFTDMKAVSNFAIGKYARRFTPDELARYREAFRTYALAVYEVQLDQYRGEGVVVEGSTDRNERDSIVDTTIRRADGEGMDVRWRVLTRNGQYQVVDVALNLDGNLIWLAIEQRAQFLSLLDKNNGSADNLIDKIESMTAKLRADQAAGRNPGIGANDASED
ncbi:MAG: ABC transporter substrate-binding protein [Pseudomonadota bacterium]